VYFLCDKARFTEEGAEQADNGAFDRLNVYGGFASAEYVIKRQLRPNLAWNDYRWAIHAISGRTLIKEEDILNCFRGILNRLDMGASVQGLPIAYIDVALL
jgi:hypothetical protein